MNQTIYEYYVVASFIAVLAVLFIGTLEGSHNIESLPYIMIACVINFIRAIYIGYKPAK